MSKDITPVASAIKKVSIEQMLEAGVHFGHQTKRKDPKMDKFVYEVVERNQIIDLYKTQAQLEKAANFLYEVAKSGKQIILVGTKRQASPIVKKYAEEAKCLYVNQRWLGGTFTNFDYVSFSLAELERIETGLKDGTFNRYTKKERLLLQRKVEKLTETVGGLRGLKKYPGAVFVVDMKREKTAVAESIALKVPVVAMVDTNSDPTKTQFAIPSNDDAIKSIDLIVSVLASAIKLGNEEYLKDHPVVVEKPKVPPAINQPVASAPVVMQKRVEQKPIEKPVVVEKKEEKVAEVVVKAKKTKVVAKKSNSKEGKAALKKVKKK